MREDQIKYMVDRFLGWRLPQDFRPDDGISFQPIGNVGTPNEYRREPMGTNLLDAAQAEAMVRYITDGMPGQAYPDPGKTMSETQKTMTDWADETFGPVSSNVRVAARANEEMAELLRALTADDHHPKAAEEIADVVIVLSRLATRLGVDLQAEIDRKMAINRARVWKLDKTGHGYHVRDKTEAA